MTNRLAGLFLGLGVMAAIPLMAGPLLAGNLLFQYYHTQGKFEDVVDDVRQAVINAGLNIDYHGKIGDMLKRTSKDFGDTKLVYKNAEFFTFCSARLSREAMKRDPQNIAFCPYSVYIYEPTDEPGTIYAGFRKFTTLGPSKSQVALERINKLLNGIIKEATE